MPIRFILFFLFFLVTSGLSASPLGPEISGMVELPEGAYLVAHDTKTGPEPPETPRLGVVRVSDSGLSYQPLRLADWGAGQEPANDLEALCELPGRPHEYLAVESGYFEGRFGRIFHLQVKPGDGGGYEASVLGYLHPDPRPHEDYTSPSHLQFEGVVCLRRGSSWVLVLGRRGSGREAGELAWGSLDLSGYRYQEQGSARLETLTGLRACADLMLHPQESGDFLLLSVAASDPGNLGPFRSRIFEAGHLRWEGDEVMFSPSRVEVVHWTLDGLKIEALTTCHLPGAPVCVGSDDEKYLGVWRPLPKTPSF